MVLLFGCATGGFAVTLIPVETAVVSAAPGILGWFGYTTTTMVASPIFGVSGIAVGILAPVASALWLRQSIKKWRARTMELNEEFVRVNRSDPDFSRLWERHVHLHSSSTSVDGCDEK